MLDIIKDARLFWDVDRERIDPDRHARFIIRRIAERGNWRELRILSTSYPHTAIRDALISARSLDARAVAFFANQFGIPRRAFRAYGQTWR